MDIPKHSAHNSYPYNFLSHTPAERIRPPKQTIRQAAVTLAAAEALRLLWEAWSLEGLVGPVGGNTTILRWKLGPEGQGGESDELVRRGGAAWPMEIVMLSELGNVGEGR